MLLDVLRKHEILQNVHASMKTRPPSIKLGRALLNVLSS